MEQEKDIEHYLKLVANAPSYQDLVFMRNKIFDVAEALCSPEDMERLKRAWTERAKDQTLPIVPLGQKKTAAS